MHTQARSSLISFFARIWEAALSFVVFYFGPVFYAVVLVLNVVTVVFRWYLVYLATLIACLLASLAVVLLGALASLVGLGFGFSVGAPGWVAFGVACVGAFGPCVWSLLAFVGRGRVFIWVWRRGIRRASAEEQEWFDHAVALLRGAGAKVPRNLRVFVVDGAPPFSEVRCGAVVVSRELIESEWLAGALAHELGHIVTLDSRLTEAFNRLVLWDDPLALPDGEFEFRTRKGAFAWGCARWFVRLAGGGLPQRVLDPVLFWYWREREFLADDYVVELGQNEQFAKYLKLRELAFDVSEPRRFVNWDTHPPVALRIERLRMG